MVVRRGAFAAVALPFLVAASLVGASLALAADHEVAIRAAGFDPPTITVLTGEPVTWTNATEAEHTVTTDDGTLDSGPIGPGEAYATCSKRPARSPTTTRRARASVARSSWRRRR
jgi:plastocyanin